MNTPASRRWKRDAAGHRASTEDCGLEIDHGRRSVTVAPTGLQLDVRIARGLPLQLVGALEKHTDLISGR
jgi:hypothetical protein